MKKNLGIAMIVMAVLGLATFGLAADQTVTVNVQATSVLTLSETTATITFPTLDTWTANTYTATSDNFNVLTFHNGTNDPDIQVSSTALASTSGATIGLNNFRIYLTPQGGTEANSALNSAATFANVGRGRKTASAHYGLTIDDTQQSGIYTGTVTFTLLNQ